MQTQGEIQEQKINTLREQRAEIEAWLDTPFALESPAETRKYENQLTKVNAEIDKAVEEERRAAVKTPLKTIIDNLDKYLLESETLARLLRRYAEAGLQIMQHHFERADGVFDAIEVIEATLRDCE